VRDRLRRIWAGWQVLGHAIGDFQARVLLTVFYIAVAGVVGPLIRRLGDPLRHRHPAGSAWHQRKPLEGTLEDARHQY
jgi:hypothetical protein